MGASDTLAEGHDVDALSSTAVREPHGDLRDARSDMREALDTMLVALVEAGGSDLHLTTNAPPSIRVHGDLHRDRVGGRRTDDQRQQRVVTVGEPDRTTASTPPPSSCTRARCGSSS